MILLVLKCLRLREKEIMSTNLLLRIGGYIDNQVRPLKSMSAQRDLATSTLRHSVVAISVRSQNQRSGFRTNRTRAEFDEEGGPGRDDTPRAHSTRMRITIARENSISHACVI